MRPSKLDVEIGQRVELHCDVLVAIGAQSCSWLYQPPGVAARPTFLLYISNYKTKLAEKLAPEQYSGKKSKDSFTLTLSSFREEDQGYYFCSILVNSEIFFSSFVPVFLPGPGVGRGASWRGAGFGSPPTRFLQPLNLLSSL